MLHLFVFQVRGAVLGLARLKEGPMADGGPAPSGRGVRWWHLDGGGD